MFLDMEQQQEAKYQQVMENVQEFYERCENFRYLAEEAFPALEKVSDKACAEAKRVNKALHVEIIKKQRKSHLMDMFKALRKNVHVQQRKTQVKFKMVDSIRR